MFELKKHLLWPVVIVGSYPRCVSATTGRCIKHFTNMLPYLCLPISVTDFCHLGIFVMKHSSCQIPFQIPNLCQVHSKVHCESQWSIPLSCKRTWGQVLRRSKAEFLDQFMVLASNLAVSKEVYLFSV